MQFIVQDLLFQVKFKKAVMVTGIDIYETFHAGGVRRIAALRNKTEWVSLWETDRVTDIHQARIFSPPLKVAKSKLLKYKRDLTKSTIKTNLL